MDEKALADLDRALVKFRKDLLDILADIQVQLAVLENACLENGAIDEAMLRRVKVGTERKRDKIYEKLVQRLDPPHVAL